MKKKAKKNSPVTGRLQSIGTVGEAFFSGWNTEDGPDLDLWCAACTVQPNQPVRQMQFDTNSGQDSGNWQRTAAIVLPSCRHVSPPARIEHLPLPTFFFSRKKEILFSVSGAIAVSHRVWSPASRRHGNVRLLPASLLSSRPDTNRPYLRSSDPHLHTPQFTSPSGAI
jgi:hypothetical protein